MRFVFDTNAIVSAVLWPEGLIAGILRAVLQRHRLVVSPEIAAEHGAIIVRSGFGSRGDAKERLG